MDTQTRSTGLDIRSTISAPSALIEAQVWAAVDGYEIREVVRRTPTNDVFLTYHRPTGAFRELMVVQRVPGVDQATLRQTIEAEIAAARAVSHVGVAPVEEVGLTRDGRLFVATARPVGRPLHTLLAEDGRLPVLRAFELGHTLVTAVAVAHERKIAHGWLTADSVIVVPPRAGWPERAVVLGLGTAAAQDAGLTVGAFSEEQSHYVSPERAAGEPPSFRSDVFSLGSLLLSMLTGSTPSVVRAPGAAGGATEDEWAPGDIEQVLRVARAADPDRRYGSAGELGAALWTVHNAWFAARSEEATAVVRSAPAVRTPGRRRTLVAAAGVLGVVAAGAAGAAARVWDGRSSAALGAPLVTTAQSAPRSPAAPPAAPPASAEPPAPPSALNANVPPMLAQQADSGVTQGERLAAIGAQVAAAQELASGRVARNAAPRPAPSPSVLSAPIASRQPTAAAVAPITPGTNVAVAPAPVTSSATGEVAVASPAAPRAAPTASAPTNNALTNNVPANNAPASDVGESDGARSVRTSEVLAMVAEYGTAIGARDLDRLAHLYPNMTEQQRRGWRTFFSSVSDLRAPLTVEQLTLAGATAQVRVRAAYEYENLRPHRAERSVVNYKLTLARDGSGWRIRAVE